MRSEGDSITYFGSICLWRLSSGIAIGGVLLSTYKRLSGFGMRPFSLLPDGWLLDRSHLSLWCSHWRGAPSGILTPIWTPRLDPSGPEMLPPSPEALMIAL
ncbi:hypothetical protein KI387_041447, partial [Taxus chinensis]